MNDKILSWILILAGIGFFGACDSDAKSATSSGDALTLKEGGIAEMVRNPVSADQEVDTTQLARIAFEEEVFQFGEVDEGAVIEHNFQFVNTGAVPLIISDVRSTCGCTVADWPKEPLAPGEQGEIEVRFDTKNKKGGQEKPVTITANTFPAKTQVYLRGQVHSTETR